MTGVHPTLSGGVFHVGGDGRGDVLEGMGVAGGAGAGAGSASVIYKGLDSSDSSSKAKQLEALLLLLSGSKSKKQLEMNFTAGNSSIVDNLASWDIDGAAQRKISLEAVIAVVLGILGLLANASTLLAISRIRNSLTANLRLIVSLCSSDMLVSVSILLRLIYKCNNTHMSPVMDVCLDHSLRAVRMTSHIVSLLNLVGLALDHYFAIIKPLKYPTLMCKKHANMMIVVFWIISAFCGFSDFIIPSAYFSYCNSSAPMHYCEKVNCTVYNEEYIMFAVAFISSLLMSALYTTIYIQINKYQSFQQAFRQNVKRNRRGLITTFVIVFTFMLTWLPYCLFDVIVIVSNKTHPEHNLHFFKVSQKLEWHFYNLLLLNSLMDPVIYAIRMREVQNGYKNILPCVKGRRRGLALTASTKRHSSTNHTTTMSLYTRQSQSESYL